MPALHISLFKAYSVYMKMMKELSVKQVKQQKKKKRCWCRRWENSCRLNEEIKCYLVTKRSLQLQTCASGFYTRYIRSVSWDVPYKRLTLISLGLVLVMGRRVKVTWDIYLQYRRCSQQSCSGKAFWISVVCFGLCTTLTVRLCEYKHSVLLAYLFLFLKAWVTL